MRRTVPVLTVAVTLTATALVAGPARAAHEGLLVTGLTQSDRLVTFAADSPGVVSDGVKVTGLGGELLGIDYRPLTDDLYGVVRDDDGTGRFVTIDDATGAVTSSTGLVGTDGAPVVLLGEAFGVDFNPAADALRIVSDADQNLRVLPSTRTAGAAGTTFVDGSLNPAGAAVTGAAYTNNDTDPATGTTLYDIASATDSLVRQDPPNAGGLVPVGPLGLAAGARTGFDVYTEGTVNVALVSLFDRGRTTVSVVNLTTGAVNTASTGTIGSRPAVVDIAAPTDQ